MSKPFILLVGASGTGKTTIANKLHSMCGLKTLDSFTDRPPRYPEENGHIFVSKEKMDNILHNSKIVAFTEYNRHRYCATESQVEENDIYIIDPYGVDWFVKNYSGHKNIKLVYLKNSNSIRFNRMLDRGDSVSYASEKLEEDAVAFSIEKINHMKNLFTKGKYLFIENENIADSLRDIYNFIKVSEA